MKRSIDHILVTHVGSLVRPAALRRLLAQQTGERRVDDDAFRTVLTESVREVVSQQVKTGIDIPSDGEYGKTGWTSYVTERLNGLEPVAAEPGNTAPNPSVAGREGDKFLEFYRAYEPVQNYDWTAPESFGSTAAPKAASTSTFQCTGPITYRDAEIKRDIANFKSALQGLQVADAFMPVAAPESARGLRRNRFYANDDAFLTAMADALKTEYQAILDAGFLIQLDDAFLAHEYDRLLVTQTEAEVRKGFEAYVEMLNHTLRGIPEDRVRYHVCWGSWNGPHTSDVPLRTLLNLVLKVKAQAYCIEAANPRHAHEFQVWEDVKLPDGKILIPGLISHSTNVVEHPELVAQRIKNFTRILGRENVIAGTDCGFSQNWNRMRVHPSVQWAKLGALVEGAQLASQDLWKG